jgi:hypothetical protein
LLIKQIPAKNCDRHQAKSFSAACLAPEGRYPIGSDGLCNQFWHPERRRRICSCFFDEFQAQHTTCDDPASSIGPVLACSMGTVQVLPAIPAAKARRAG